MVENTYGLKWSDERIAELRRLFDEGLNNPQIAKAMGISLLSVVGKLRRLGLKRSEQFTVWTDDRIEELKRLFEENLSASETAAKMGGGLTRLSIIGKWHRLGLKRGRKGTYRKPAEPTKARKPTICSVSRWSAFSVESKPQELPDEPVVDVVPLHLSLDELNGKTCRWPYGHGPHFTFCGCDVLQGSSYCSSHKAKSIGRGTASERSAARDLRRAA